MIEGEIHVTRTPNTNALSSTVPIRPFLFTWEGTPTDPLGISWPQTPATGWWDALHSFPTCYLRGYSHTIIPHDGWDDTHCTLHVEFQEPTEGLGIFISCVRTFTPTHHTLLRYHAWMQGRGHSR